MEDKKLYTITELLTKVNLNIPNYQRPYKWDVKNMSDLLQDIDSAIINSEKYEEFKYRIGTIIIHENEINKKIDIVDGQQRIISLVLIGKFIETFTEKNCSIFKIKFNNTTTKFNMYYNYMFIKDWFSLKKEGYQKKVCDAMEKILEVVVLKVNTETEAFQLFDSQNTRGKSLYPHDLLKAYHLRAMQGNPYEMRHVVQKWEAVNSEEIKELFEYYLFPIKNWTKQLNTSLFTVKEIDQYKGIAESTNYTYAKRAKSSMPYFQLTETFIEGQDYFEMVEHYLEMLKDIRLELSTNDSFTKMNELLQRKDGMGYKYIKNLFLCALMCYYDKFHNFEEKVVKKLFLWAFLLRVDMERVGYDTINKYTLGKGDDSKYSNSIPMFFLISQARLHIEVENIVINSDIEEQKLENNKWKELYEELITI